LEYFKNPKEGVDYSKFDESSIANVKTLRELNIGELEQVDDTFLLKSPLKKSLLERSSYFSQGISRYEQQSGQTGENLYESMSQKFVRDSLYKNIRQAQFDVQPFIPTLKEHGEHYTPRHREQLKEGFQSTEDFESKGIDMQTINYKDNYWIVVSAFEK
jgi:phenylalanyl-tRNA synthetase alpha subunit